MRAPFVLLAALLFAASSCSAPLPGAVSRDSSSNAPRLVVHGPAASGGPFDPGSAPLEIDLAAFEGKVVWVTFYSANCCSWPIASRRIEAIAAAHAREDLVHLLIDRTAAEPWEAPAGGTLRDLREIRASDFEGRSEQRLRTVTPEFFSGSPSDYLIDRHGRLRTSEPGCLPLELGLDRLLAEE